MNEEEIESIEESPENTSANPDEEVTLESPKGEIKGEVQSDKKTIERLLKKKKIFIVGILVVLMFLFLLIAMVMEGSEVHDYVYYENGEDLKNHKVNITYRKFGSEEEKESEMDLEEYITKAVYAYSQAIKNIEKKENKRFDYHIYWALSIALRNEALTNNYEVEYHDDKDLFKNYEKDEQIDFALEKAKNLVMVDDNDKLVSTHASSFCWNELDDEKHVLFQNGLYVPNDFSNSYVSYDVYNECECNKSSGIIESSVPFNDEDSQCWIYFEEEIEHHYVDANGNDATDIEIIYKKEYLHQEEEDGFSLYGAYYFWHEKGLNYLQILTTFYGADIRIKTLEKGENENTKKSELSIGGTCDNSAEVPYNSTSLTKTEFSQKVEEFFQKGNYADYAKLFVQYSGQIYDMGIEKGINPELIYIFARKETAFTERNGGDVDHYNYYGLGHGNTASHGTYYSSFMEGVEALYDYFVSKGSLEAFRSYSYIGTYWYNPGSSGLGGCYYYPYLQKDLGVQDSYIAEACSSAHRGCTSNNTGNCVKTRTVDQDYYFSWQKNQYAKHRKAIFGLDAVNCYNGNTAATLEIPSSMLKQPLNEFLSSHNSGVTELNETILKNVMSAGVGTRKGVVAAATTLINYMNQYGVRLPYTYGGGHYANIAGARKNSTSYYGVDPEWGSSIGNYKDSGTGYGPYTHFGPDCSAFVSWVLHNGGIKFSVANSTSMKSLGPNHSMDGSYVGKIGDPVVSPGHVQLIVGVNESEKYYILAESAGLGSSYTPDTKGISYTKVPFISSKHTIVDFESYYANSDKHYSNEDFEAVYREGMLS